MAGERLELHPATRSILERMLTLVTTLDLLIAQVNPEIEVRAKHNAQARLLTTISGIGYYSAVLIVAEIDGVERFPDARHLCSYAGLVPSLRASADHVRHGNITKQGSPWLRWILVEICQKAQSRDDVLGEHYRRVVRLWRGRRQGGHRAQAAEGGLLHAQGRLQFRPGHATHAPGPPGRRKQAGASSVNHMATKGPFSD